MIVENTKVERIKDVNRNLFIKTKDGEYSNSHLNRGCLTAYWDSKYKKSAIAIGINPSKADNNRSDKTITTLSRFLDSYGYNEFLMLNIFESYSTDQSGIDQTTRTDFNKYREAFEKVNSIFIVWGLEDTYESEKREILTFLREYEDKIFCLKNKNERFPIHPSRMNYGDTVIKCKLKIN